MYFQGLYLAVPLQNVKRVASPRLSLRRMEMALVTSRADCAVFVLALDFQLSHQILGRFSSEDYHRRLS
jgi:hypothetical protein